MGHLVNKVNRVDLVSLRRQARAMVLRVKVVHLVALEEVKEVAVSGNKVESRNNMDHQAQAKARLVDSVDSKVESRNSTDHRHPNHNHHQVRNMAHRRVVNSKAVGLLVPNMEHHNRAVAKAKAAELQARNTGLRNKAVVAVSVMIFCP